MAPKGETTPPATRGGLAASQHLNRRVFPSHFLFPVPTCAYPLSSHSHSYSSLHHLHRSKPTWPTQGKNRLAVILTGDSLQDAPACPLSSPCGLPPCPLFASVTHFARSMWPVEPVAHLSSAPPIVQLELPFVSSVLTLNPLFVSYESVKSPSLVVLAARALFHISTSPPIHTCLLPLLQYRVFFGRYLCLYVLPFAGADSENWLHIRGQGRKAVFCLETATSTDPAVLAGGERSFCEESQPFTDDGKHVSLTSPDISMSVNSESFFGIILNIFLAVRSS